MDIPLVKCLAHAVHSSLVAAEGNETSAALEINPLAQKSFGITLIPLTKKAAVATPRPIARVEAILTDEMRLRS